VPKQFSPLNIPHCIYESFQKRPICVNRLTQASPILLSDSHLPPCDTGPPPCSALLTLRIHSRYHEKLKGCSWSPTTRAVPVKKLLSALCYLCGRVSPAPRRSGSPPSGSPFSWPVRPALLRETPRILPPHSSPSRRSSVPGADEILCNRAVRFGPSASQIAEFYASLPNSARCSPTSAALNTPPTSSRGGVEAKYFIRSQQRAPHRLKAKRGELVEESIAKASSKTLPSVQRANISLGHYRFFPARRCHQHPLPCRSSSFAPSPAFLAIPGGDSRRPRRRFPTACPSRRQGGGGGGATAIPRKSHTR